VRKTYSNVRGTLDFGPAESSSFQKVASAAKEIFELFGYQEIILPLLEERELFIKGVGSGTDIVDRQMFKIEDKDIVLRPEGTAQVVRYYLQNALYKQGDFHKFFYSGAMFRGERPQKGRLRQFHHLGAEAIGSDSFYLDAEMIDLSLRILEAAGIKEKKLMINSLGCPDDKEKFSRLLKGDLEKRKSRLCEDCQRRLEKNPLRVLDCKKEECSKQVRGFMHAETGGKEYLCKECFDKYKNLLNLLEGLGIKYEHNSCLVRGLDYYTNTVFEITSPKLGSQDAIGAGGRYNNLIHSLGGPQIPAVGFALGVERILLVLGEAREARKTDVFVAVVEKDLFSVAFKILNNLRKKALSADCDYNQKSLKGQLRVAQKIGVRYVIIVGSEELKEDCVILKDMEKGTQEKIKIDRIIEICCAHIPAAN